MATTIAFDASWLDKTLSPLREYKGYGAWTAAETSGTVKVPFTKIVSAEISSNDTALPVAHAISLTVSSGALDISRAAGGTAGASFSFTVRGW